MFKVHFAVQHQNSAARKQNTLSEIVDVKCGRNPREFYLINLLKESLAHKLQNPV